MKDDLFHFLNLGIKIAIITFYAHKGIPKVIRKVIPDIMAQCFMEIIQSICLRSLTTHPNDHRPLLDKMNTKK